MPQMGVSVSEGTIVEWRKQVGDWVDVRGGDLRHLDRQDRHRGARRPRPGAWPRSSSRSARRSRSAPCSRGSPPTPSPGRRTPPSERRAADERGRGGDRRHAGRGDRDAVARAGHAPAATTRRARGARGARRYSPVVQRIAAEHGVDLDQVQGTGRGGRVRKQDVLAFVEPAAGARGAARSRRCTSSRPTGPSPRRRPPPAPAAARPTALQPGGRSRACAARSAST